MQEVKVATKKARSEIVVEEADTMMAMLRGKFSAAADSETDPVRWYAKAYMIPDCLACSTGTVMINIGKVTKKDDGEIFISAGETVQVGDLTFEQYMGLPDQITEAWLSAVYKENPHWAPVLPTSKDEQEKKA